MIEDFHFSKADFFLEKKKHKQPQRGEIFLEVATQNDEEEIDRQAYDFEGVRVSGTFIFEAPTGHNFVKKNTCGHFLVLDEDHHGLAQFNVVFTEEPKQPEVVIPERVKRHTWNFFAIGKPVCDHLKIWPERVRREKLKVYIVKDFRGLSVVNAVVVATDKKDALFQLKSQFREQNSNLHESNDFEFEEVDITTSQAILFDNF